MRKAIVAKLLAAMTAGVLAAFIVAGCATPVSSQKASALLPKNAAISGENPDRCLSAETLVVAQCTRVEEYDSTVKGDWVQHWYVTEWRAIRIERGEWPAETLSFVFHDRSPASGSGIVLREAPPAYYRGAVMGFCIKASGSKPVIVAQQARSRVPSYGTLRRPKYDARDPESTQVFQSVIEAARRFVQRAVGGGGALAVTEEYDRFFVVEVRTADDSVALRVEKGSYRVTRIPDAYGQEE